MAQSSKAPPGSLAQRKGEVGWCNMVESSFRMSPYKDTGERRSQCHAAPQESNSMQGGVAGGGIQAVSQEPSPAGLTQRSLVP